MLKAATEQEEPLGSRVAFAQFMKRRMSQDDKDKYEKMSGHQEVAAFRRQWAVQELNKMRQVCQLDKAIAPAP
eukprot:1450045-Lingulodinium_polyedra.AAC.1